MVGEHDCREKERVGEFLVLGLHKDRGHENEACDHHQKKRRQDPRGTARAEFEETELSSANVRANLIDDQIAGDDEKDVDPDEAASE